MAGPALLPRVSGPGPRLPRGPGHRRVPHPTAGRRGGHDRTVPARLTACGSAFLGVIIGLGRSGPRRPAGHDRGSSRRGSRPALASRSPLPTCRAGRGPHVRGACLGRSCSASSPTASGAGACSAHARHLSRRHDPDRALLLAAVVLRLPVPDRHGHRRRVQRDQLRDRRADPRAARGRADISINGSYWGGAIGGSLLAVLALNTAIFPLNVGCGCASRSARSSAQGILLVRRHVPESPRWLFIHGREEEAEQIVSQIEDEVRRAGEDLPEPEGTITVHQRRTIPLPMIVRSVVSLYPRRTLLGWRCSSARRSCTTRSCSASAICSRRSSASPAATSRTTSRSSRSATSLGPLTLGRLFDTVGRSPMIAGSYILSGALLIVTAFLFRAGT